MATFDRIHRKLLEYCDYDPSHCPVSERILTEYIEQLLLKDEDSMPSEFLNDLENKINVLSILKSKIEKSSQLSEDIDKLWVRWLKRLFRKVPINLKVHNKNFDTPQGPVTKKINKNFPYLKGSLALLRVHVELKAS